MCLGSFKEAIKFWSGHEIYLEELGLEDFLVSGGKTYLLSAKVTSLRTNMFELGDTAHLVKHLPSLCEALGSPVLHKIEYASAYL